MARQETKYIVVHCSQTRPSQDWGAKEIDRVHREFGWSKIGYGKVIKRDGTVEQGRADDAVQAHVKGYNHMAYGLCLIGGAKEDDWRKPEDNFTAEQWQSLYDTLNELVAKYPEARFVGHYELDESKTCPNFSVRDYLLHENIKNYKFQDGLTDEADLAELEAEDFPELEEDEY
jgi:N-acetylmuramoyl-L-alanine amidase